MSELSRAPIPVLEPGTRAPAPPFLGGRPARQGFAPLRWIVANGRIAFGGTVIGIAALVAAFAPVLAPQRPEAQYVQLRLAPPGSAFILGGDGLGRDVLSRLIFAGRVSLSIGLLSMLITLIVGVSIGAIAGYFGGWADRLLMRLTDLVLVFPTFFLLILAVATFGRSLTLLILMIGFTSWPANARVVRALMLKLRRQDFVAAARVIGADDLRIVARHLVPQLIPVIIASATIRVASNILIESGLSYLGLGVAEPTASWGNMVADGARFARQAWWLVVFPGAAIFLVVLAFNLFGEGLRDALDPTRRRR
ncbi:MAG: ABC transporter permease [Chloroflexota bacterium]|nr:ABC transporter permease [Chloroflexota bacterium]